MERVSVISDLLANGGFYGKNHKRPIVVVAPHGFDGDDERTSLITERIATNLNCHAVINRGWERSKQVDIFNDKADCNNINHCMHDVVKEEFLEALQRCVIKCIKPNNIALQNCFILHIHGMSNKHRTIAKDSNLDIVLGYGAGFPNSYSCKKYHKDFLLNRLHEVGFTVYTGKKGGPMSGWSRNNLNQYYKKWYDTPMVNSAQIEIIYERRKDKSIANETADLLTEAIDGIDMIDSYENPTSTKFLSY